MGAWIGLATRSPLRTAFQAEGMVILDIASRLSPAIRVFTLDTGRLPEETYQMIETIRGRYGISVETASPDSAEVESMVALHGPNLFYRAVPLRNLCCEIRKIRPLERKLQELEAGSRDSVAIRMTHERTCARSSRPEARLRSARWPIGAPASERVYPGA